MPSRETSERAEPEREAALDAPARGQAGTIERVIGLQRSIGNRRTAALVGGMQPRAISRYKILGPWNIGEAVHETLTLLAVKQAKERLIAKGEDPGYLLWGFGTDSGIPDTSKPFNFDTKPAKEAQAQFLRGVIWADDPEGLLFDVPQDLSDFSSGFMWNEHFKEGKQGKFDTLTARSHFGDLQFFHGMASSDKEAPKTTKSHMLNWARFLVNVATGATLTFTKLKDVAEVSALFPKLGERTVKELFGWGAGHFEDIRQRAIGALFHMIQEHSRTATSSAQEERDRGIPRLRRAGREEACRARRARRLLVRVARRPPEEDGRRAQRHRRVRDGDGDDRRGQEHRRDRRPPRQDGLGAGVGREAGGAGRRIREAQGEGEAVVPAQTTSPWRIVFSVTTRGSTNCSR